MRAIAVLAVIIFHINEHILPGGFAGVDIFFVISGYLITLHIFRDLNNKKFSIIEFYRKRVKRIIPAVLAVVFLTILITQLIFLPDDAEKVAESGLWSLLSLSNVYFWLFEDVSYFAAASDEKPLLHLWSLGVEEQFYIFWPLILLFTYKLGHGKNFLFIFGSVAIASFLFGEYIYSHDPSFSYYMLPTRAGELLIGALLAQFIFKRSAIQVQKYAITLISLVGGSLVLGSLILLSEHEVFPGIRAIPPTVGTAMLIFSGHYGNPLLNRVLALQPMVWVGAISYSAYLWHWPILAFYRYGYAEVTLISGVTIFALTILIAQLSYRYIETPFRNAKGSAISVIVRQYIIPSICIAFIALVSMKLDGYGFRWFSDGYRSKITALRDENRPAYQYDYVCQSQVITQNDVDNRDCVLGTESNIEPDVILWGDSNAAHYIGILGAFAEKEGFGFRNLQLGACPPLDVESSKYASGKRVADCNNSRQIILDTLNKYKLIIISANWTEYQTRSDTFLNAFFEMVQTFVEKDKKLILIGKAPVIHSFDRRCREKAVSFPFVVCNTVDVPIDKGVAQSNKALKDFAERTNNVEYYDFNNYLCPNSICSVRGKNGELIYYDSSHLALEASWKIGRNIVDTDGVPFPFSSFVNSVE